MKITSTFMAILMGCAVLALNACDDNSGSKNKTKQNQMLLLLGGKKYAIGDTGPSGVGIVFYITDGGKHGLEAAPIDQSGSQVWIEGGSTQTTANGNTATAIGTGLANLNFIIAQTGHTGSAAQICRNYTGGSKTDWFLPSQDELNELYLQKAVVGGFAGGTYWSSSEYSAALARFQDFGDGTQGSVSKANTFRVRAVRAF